MLFKVSNNFVQIVVALPRHKFVTGATLLQLLKYLSVTDTFFIQKIDAPSSSLLQGKHLPFTPSPLRLNIFRLFVILSLTQLYRVEHIFIMCIGTIICILKVYFTFERR
jgi:hypothetical protein